MKGIEYGSILVKTKHIDSQNIIYFRQNIILYLYNTETCAGDSLQFCINISCQKYISLGICRKSIFYLETAEKNVLPDNPG